LYTCPDSSEFLSVIPAISGFVGALVGGGATLLATHLTAAATERRRRADLLASKGEELVTLLAEVQYWFSEVHKSSADLSLEMPPMPTEPYRVQALTEAYFPALSPLAQALVVAATEYRNILTDRRTTKELERDGRPWQKRNTLHDFAKAYSGLIDTAEELRKSALNIIHSRSR
jgi:hypothetical protein